MLKGEDIVILLKLCGQPREMTLRSLEADIGIPKSVIQRSLLRLAEAGLLDAKQRRVNASRAEEFLVHGLKYVFPPIFQGETRGVPTAWAAAPLKDELAPATELPPVWPDAMGPARGIALLPLHGSAPVIARNDPTLAELLALVDAIRIGDARVRGVAIRLLSDRILAPVTAA